jgi:hypothetical protein
MFSRQTFRLWPIEGLVAQSGTLPLGNDPIPDEGSKADFSNSAHGPQNAFVDFQQLAHLEVHGRNARKKFGVVSF